MLADRKFKAIKIGLMRSKEFGLLRGVAMHGKTFLTTDIPTAATNGRDCWFNPDFMFKQIRNGDKGAAFVMVHEWLHKAGMHLVTYRRLAEQDARVTNMGADYWNNDRILCADPKHILTEMPEDENGKQMGLYDPKYHGWTIKRIFQELKKEQDEKESGKESGDGTTGSNNAAVGFDEHDWEGAEELTAEESKQLTEDITQAIRQGIHADAKAGEGGLHDALGLGELVAPKVSWRALLRMFMNSTCRKKEQSTWRRPNRRFLHQDILMPSLQGNSINEIVIGRDTSGSMLYGDRLKTVTSEIVGIAKAISINKIHVIDWDGEVENHGVYSSDTLSTVPDIKRAFGGGGTDPACVSTYLKEKGIKPDCVIMLTDGEIYNWGNWTSPLLWAITNHKKITAPLGKTIQID
jgi:predicted metal-dependent peptidase